MHSFRYMKSWPLLFYYIYLKNILHIKINVFAKRICIHRCPGLSGMPDLTYPFPICWIMSLFELKEKIVSPTAVLTWLTPLSVLLINCGCRRLLFLMKCSAPEGHGASAIPRVAKEMVESMAPHYFGFIMIKTTPVSRLCVGLDLCMSPWGYISDHCLCVTLHTDRHNILNIPRVLKIACVSPVS